MKRALDRGFAPPAPMVPSRVRAPQGADWEALDAKVDTGADLSAVPDRALEALDVAPVRVVRAASFAGALQEVPVYRVDLELAGELVPRAVRDARLAELAQAEAEIVARPCEWVRLHAG